MIVHSLADITGDAAVHQLSTTPLNAKWIQMVTPSTNSAVVRIGGSSSISATRGLPIPIGWAGQMLPPIAELTEFYDLSNLYYYAAVGDKLHILYGG